MGSATPGRAETAAQPLSTADRHQLIWRKQQKGGHMSIWLLILIVLVVLALGGFGYSRR
jgi:flagellar basal body-associated protein FliL